MKKILMSLIVASVLLVSFGVVSAKATTCATIQGGTLTDVNGNPISLGYDQWGYNYQAHMFNGLYDNYNRPNPVATSGDSLMMKWNDAWLSNQDCDKDGKLDRPANYIGSGAWLTNHANGTYESPWDVSGDWVITVNNGAYPHDYTFTMTSLPDGTFTGVGGYPAGALDYVFDEVVVNGQINGNTISFTSTYSQNGYVWNAIGTIASDGTMSGTGDAGVYEWHSTSGAATKETCSWSDFVKIVAVPTSAHTKSAIEKCPALYELDEKMWYTVDGVEIGCSIWGDFALIQDEYSDPCGLKQYDQQYHSPLRSGLGHW